MIVVAQKVLCGMKCGHRCGQQCVMSEQVGFITQEGLHINFRTLIREHTTPNKYSRKLFLRKGHLSLEWEKGNTSTLANGRSYFRVISCFFNHHLENYKASTLKKKYQGFPHINSWPLIFGEKKGANMKYLINLIHHMLSIPTPPILISNYFIIANYMLSSSISCLF